jgi:hypothetical protein
VNSAPDDPDVRSDRQRVMTQLARIADLTDRITRRALLVMLAAGVLLAVVGLVLGSAPGVLIACIGGLLAGVALIYRWSAF